jgi:hypothetical protein
VSVDAAGEAGILIYLREEIIAHLQSPPDMLLEPALEADVEGSTLAALRAGTQQAASATDISSAVIEISAVNRCAERLSIPKTSMSDVTFRFRNRTVPEPDISQRCISRIILIKSSLSLS